jgi:hypothetical protein
MGGAFWITIIFMILTGLLACAGMIAARKPNAGAALSKLVPFQGIIGILALIWGVWTLIEAITGGVLELFSLIPVTVLLLLAASVLMILLGFLFGWTLIARVTGGGGQATAVQQKIAGIQGPLGVLTIIVAVLLVIFTLFKLGI